MNNPDLADAADGTADRDHLTTLVLAYRETGNERARDALFVAAQPFVIGMAKRFQGRGAENDDLIQTASIALLRAVDRFDPARGVPFLGFAAPTVLGELRKYFRTAWSVHVPRSLQESTQRLRPAVDQLHHELGRSPTVAEIAERLEWTSDRVLETMEVASAYRAKSLDTPTSAGSAVALHATVPAENSEAAFDLIDARETVARLLPRLSERSRRIVELRFYEERSQDEIAEIVGMSQMHVSRLLKRALEELAEAAADGS